MIVFIVFISNFLYVKCTYLNSVYKFVLKIVRSPFCDKGFGHLPVPFCPNWATPWLFENMTYFIFFMGWEFFYRLVFFILCLSFLNSVLKCTSKNYQTSILKSAFRIAIEIPIQVWMQTASGSRMQIMKSKVFYFLWLSAYM